MLCNVKINSHKKVSIDHSCEVLAAKQNVLVACTTKVGIDHSCEVWLTLGQQFNLWKPDKVFLFFALAAIMCSQATHAGDMHN